MRLRLLMLDVGKSPRHPIESFALEGLRAQSLAFGYCPPPEESGRLFTDNPPGISGTSPARPESRTELTQFLFPSLSGYADDSKRMESPTRAPFERALHGTAHFRIVRLLREKPLGERTEGPIQGS